MPTFFAEACVKKGCIDSLFIPEARVAQIRAGVDLYRAQADDDKRVII
jgi:hypothetical protein